MKELPKLRNADVCVGAALTERIAIPQAVDSRQDKELTAFTELFPKLERTRLLNETTGDKNIRQLLYL